MKSYTSRSGLVSGVNGYKIEGDTIHVRFINGITYIYTPNSCGETAIEDMKTRALDSLGLSTYIAQNKPGYERSYGE